MTTVSPTSARSQEKAWEGFAPGHWQEAIDVRDFIQRNYTPYEGDAEFLSGPTDKTLRVWDHLEKNYLSVERERRVYDVDTHTPADIDAFGAGFISDDDDVIVGLQTDTPLKRAMMPFGGWRMVQTAIKEAGKEPEEQVKEIFTRYRKTHNDAVFDIYTPRIRAARSSHIITGLPDATAADASSATTAALLSTAWTPSSRRNRQPRMRWLTSRSPSTGHATVRSTQNRLKPSRN